MPLLQEDTEFGSKWKALCAAHLNEGIKYPIKVYEYLNWFYVIEGNKRVSVLKYFGAYSINARIYRLIPEKDLVDMNNCIYYEFLKFNKKTGINSIWFTSRNSFEKLGELMDDYDPYPYPFDNKYKYFEVYIYNVFRKIYKELGGDELPITTEDAFLEYSKIYGIPQRYDESVLKRTVKELIKELEIYNGNTKVEIQVSPEEHAQRGMISAITNLIKPSKKLKVAFAYARTISGSGWTYGHELGRKYLEERLWDSVTTGCIENVPENGDSYYEIKKLAEDGNDVIFTTSPVFMKSTLRCTLEYPEVKFFNCSENQPYKHLSNYFGRTYEPRFLTGIIAGSMTQTDIIGYAATSPTPEVVSCINAFALGCRMVNPRAKVNVAWTNEWNSHVKFTDADEKLIKKVADIICNRNLSVPREVTAKYGVYSMLCTINRKTLQAEKYLAAPIWRCGIFYEKMVGNILNETFKTITEMFSTSPGLVNFWWGMGYKHIKATVHHQRPPKLSNPPLHFPFCILKRRVAVVFHAPSKPKYSYSTIIYQPAVNTVAAIRWIFFIAGIMVPGNIKNRSLDHGNYQRKVFGFQITTGDYKLNIFEFLRLKMIPYI